MDGLHSAFRASEIGRPGQRQEPVADHDPRRRDQPGPDQDGGVLPPARPTPSWLGCKPGTSATKPTGRRWPIWSTHSSAIPSPSTGATAPPHRRTARTSAPAARPRAPATSTRNTGAAQGGRSTPTFLTSTRHFTPRS